MQLVKFVRQHPDEIEREWEAFARGMSESSKDLDVPTLRNHLREILSAIADDMQTSQSGTEQTAKSHGEKRIVALDRVTAIHARMRVDNGFSLRHIIAEYRALRASILRLYAEHTGSEADLNEITRFNETIDQSVARVLEYYEELSTAHSMRLIGALVHDIRNPLGTIELAAQVLVERGADAAKLSRITRSVQQAQRLIDDLAIYIRSRFAVGLPLVRTDCDLGLICEQVLEDAHTAHPDKVFTFRQAGELRGNWDREQLVRIVANLLGNAAVHGGGREIQLEAQGEAAEVILKVTNQGNPIPPDKLNGIFDPLVRATTSHSSSLSSGLGLGLFIVRELVRAHGGAVAVTSSAKRGTIFTVRVPR
jgi:signal transduction histidine kinase